MTSLAAQVTATGISAPDYATILAAIEASYQSIYGSDVVLTPDSQDGQLLAIFAAAVNDTNTLAIATYNQFSPATSQGAGFSSVVKINGLARQIASASTAIVTVVGQVGSIISNGLVGDNLSQNTVWALPATVTIPVSGQIDVTATCTTVGAVSLSANTLTKILTPTLGWQTVTNADASTPGAPVETDAQLRQRQAKSTALPAQAVLAGIVGEVLNLSGVQRLAAYDNDTDSTDLNGIPSHSISLIVEGGDAMEIATAIANKKTPGTGTYGDVVEIVFDSMGVPNRIKFFDLELVTVSVTIHLRALVGFVSTTEDAIKEAVAAFISGLDIGELSYTSRLWAPAGLSGDVAVAATGQAQTQLDALARTFQVSAITQTRSANPAVTQATLGPYGVGVTVFHVGDVSKFYYGAAVQIVLDDASLLTTTITSIVDDTLEIANGVPAGRSLPTGSNVYLVNDVNVTFKEAASCLVADITLDIL